MQNTYQNPINIHYNNQSLVTIISTIMMWLTWKQTPNWVYRFGKWEYGAKKCAMHLRYFQRQCVFTLEVSEFADLIFWYGRRRLTTFTRCILTIFVLSLNELAACLRSSSTFSKVLEDSSVTPWMGTSSLRMEWSYRTGGMPKLTVLVDKSMFDRLLEKKRTSMQNQKLQSAQRSEVDKNQRFSV